MPDGGSPVGRIFRRGASKCVPECDQGRSGRHEGTVLDGIRGLLRDRRPREIQQEMEAQSLRVLWTDMSHIIGVRTDH